MTGFLSKCLLRSSRASQKLHKTEVMPGRTLSPLACLLRNNMLYFLQAPQGPLVRTRRIFRGLSHHHPLHNSATKKGVSQMSRSHRKFSSQPAKKECRKCPEVTHVRSRQCGHHHQFSVCPNYHKRSLSQENTSAAGCKKDF